MSGGYDYHVVVLSAFIAVVGSYCALELGGRATNARGRARLSWLIGGAAAMGFGVGSMHFVGMPAFGLQGSFQYDWPTALLALVTAILTAAFSLFIVSR